MVNPIRGMTAAQLSQGKMNRLYENSSQNITNKSINNHGESMKLMDYKEIGHIPSIQIVRENDEEFILNLKEQELVVNSQQKDIKR